MTRYYCTTHKDEDLDTLVGEKLDACTNHMVSDSFYDVAQYLKAPRPDHVVWEMERDATAKFGYRFCRLYGVPA